jgi:hypothetical protein
MRAVRRCVALLALLFSSGLVTMAGMLACVYGMPGCEPISACHRHQQPVKCKSDCCHNEFATSQPAALAQSGKLTPGVMNNATTSATVAMVVPVGLRPDVVNRSDGPSPRILTLRV